MGRPREGQGLVRERSELVLQMEKAWEAIYGQQHLPCRVAVNAKVGAGV